ncbi:Os07g0513450 [Oryza sativa Japonica Group]|uniref:Os07g0513450 protein n=3 Tax=Oryza TaxID=4527 RepID=B9FXH3_ORYSJ|nr:hypothetical protein OsJ_24426 [Oryza sativa Japonica Group]BAT01735.1 Os07g0513450 [Oryza sativa Japonica Group]
MADPNTLDTRVTAAVMKHWAPPPAGKIKLNVDAAYQANRKTGGWGFVLRDEEGHALLAGAGRLEFVHDVVSAEARACLSALLAISVQGVTEVEIESDSAILVSAVTSSSHSQAVGATIFAEIKMLLQLHFANSKVSFAPRSCNNVAHNLAKIGVSWDPDQSVVWVDPLPYFVRTLVIRDRTESPQ